MFICKFNQMTTPEIFPNMVSYENKIDDTLSLSNKF